MENKGLIPQCEEHLQIMEMLPIEKFTREDYNEFVKLLTAWEPPKEIMMVYKGIAYIGPRNEVMAALHAEMIKDIENSENNGKKETRKP